MLNDTATATLRAALAGEDDNLARARLMDEPPAKIAEMEAKITDLKAALEVEGRLARLVTRGNAPYAYDVVVCCLPRVMWQYDADGNLLPSVSTCDGDVHVSWHGIHEVVPKVKPEELGAGGVSFSWEVICENGHTLAVSYNQGSGEAAEDFVAELVLGIRF